MEIKWIKCTDVMPPRSTSRMIFKDNNSGDMFIAESITPHIFYISFANLSYTTYTPEKWRELHEQNSQKE